MQNNIFENIRNHGLACKACYLALEAGWAPESIARVLKQNLKYKGRTEHFKEQTIKTMAGKWRDGYFKEDGTVSEKAKKQAQASRQKRQNKEKTQVIEQTDPILIAISSVISMNASPENKLSLIRKLVL